MIEKLPFTEIHTGGEDMVDRVELRPVSPYEMQHKVNEIVDAVNSLRDDCNLLMEYIAPENKCKPGENGSRAKNAQGSFARQCGWIGCVCRFWYDNPDDTVLDYLGKIQTGKNGVEYYGKETYDWFPHCEPVKPDSQLIYHGE